jgi:hypothetical protein
MAGIGPPFPGTDFSKGTGAAAGKPEDLNSLCPIAIKICFKKIKIIL